MIVGIISLLHYNHQVLTRDSVTISVDAVVYYRVSNSTLCKTSVENAHHSTMLLSQVAPSYIYHDHDYYFFCNDQNHHALPMYWYWYWYINIFAGQHCYHQNYLHIYYIYSYISSSSIIIIINCLLRSIQCVMGGGIWIRPLVDPSPCLLFSTLLLYFIVINGKTESIVTELMINKIIRNMDFELTQILCRLSLHQFWGLSIFTRSSGKRYQATMYQVPCTKYQPANTKYHISNTKYQIPGTKCTCMYTSDQQIWQKYCVYNKKNIPRCLFSDRHSISGSMRHLLDEATEPWGIKVLNQLTLTSPIEKSQDFNALIITVIAPYSPLYLLWVGCLVLKFELNS